MALPPCRLPLPASLLAAFLIAPCPAQNPSQLYPAGLLVGMPPAEVTISTLSTGPNSEVMLRIPGEAYRGLGHYVAPGRHRIHGAIVHLFDGTVADGELFDVHLYLEAGSSNLPTIQGPQLPGATAVASVRDVTTPQGIEVHAIEVRFDPPADVPVGSDLFVSVHKRTPGLRMRVIGGTSTPGISTSFLDACGAGLSAGEAFAFAHEPAVGALFALGSGLVGWQPLIELLVDGPSGVAVSRRNANTPPTASMYSGLHPDSALPSNQPGRRDQPGYVFLANGGVPVGSPVVLLGSAMPFAGGPWLVLSPGDAALHLAPFGLVTLAAGAVAPNGQSELYWWVPQSPAIRGIDLRTQAFAFDLGTGTAAAGAAVRQRF